MICKIKTASILLVGVLCFSSVLTAAEATNQAITNKAPKKEPSFSIYYFPALNIMGEMKVYKGLSLLAGVGLMAEHQIIIDRTHSISWKKLRLGARYYVSGEPLHHGLFLSYLPAISFIEIKKEIHKFGGKNTAATNRSLWLQNYLTLGYRWAIIDSFFIELEGGVSSNIIIIKDPNSYGTIRKHQFLPSLSLAFGFSF